jgi:DNA-directed RNA polymerase alpha subunit
MTKTELLDHFAISAMNAQIEKFGITNYFSLAQSSYRLAIEMLEHRDRIHAEWEKKEEQQHLYKNANLHELNLPLRYFNCLRAEDIYTKEQLCKWDIRDLRKIPNLGAKGVQMIKEAMAETNLKLKGQE